MMIDNLWVGALSINIFSGRISFGDVKFATKDYEIRVIDCVVMVKWWLTGKRPKSQHANPGE